MEGRKSAAPALPHGQRAAGQLVFIDVPQLGADGVFDEVLGKTLGKQFVAQSFDPHRLAGQPTLDPPFCIGAIIEISKILKPTDYGPGLTWPGALRSQQRFDLGRGPIESSQIPDGRLEPAIGGLRCRALHSRTDSSTVWRFTPETSPYTPTLCGRLSSRLCSTCLSSLGAAAPGFSAPARAGTPANSRRFASISRANG